MAIFYTDGKSMVLKPNFDLVMLKMIHVKFMYYIANYIDREGNWPL